MPPKQHKPIPTTAEVVDLNSSDDEDAGGACGGVARSSNRIDAKPSNRIDAKPSNRIDAKPSNNAKLPSKLNITTPITSQAGSLSAAANYQPLENRSFWRVGAHEIGPAKSVPVQGDLEHARVHPKFLHSNATSHKWAFGAIAELLDNAVDEISNGATFVKVDRVYNAKDSSPALVFKDDGGGMDPECMRKCMSLGYSSKTSNTTIGQCN